MSAISRKSIEAHALELLTKAEAMQVPVPIGKIAGSLGVSLSEAELGDVSGVLIVKGNSAAIGYNAFEARVRQRFSIAHELGHFILHRGKRELFIDGPRPAVFHRDHNSATGVHSEEVQANQFAAALLMPEQLVSRALLGLLKDRSIEPVSDLADMFQVSVQAMTIRLANLGLVDLAGVP